MSGPAAPPLKPMDQETIGERLRLAREALPASIYQAARDTKIRVDFIEAMEQDNFRFLSGGTYVKGMLKSYAKWLGLPEDEFAEMFDDEHAATTVPTIERLAAEPAQRGPRSRKPGWLVAGGMAATILLVLSLIGVMNPVNDVAAPPSTPPDGQSASSSPSSPSTSTVAQAPVVPEGVSLTLTIVGKSSWIRVVTDPASDTSAAAFEGTLPTGSTKTFTAKQLVRVLIGDVTAVRITLNGRDLGVAPGSKGQIGRFDFKPETTTLVRG
jgi:cytoskeletal protein RodZ